MEVQTRKPVEIDLSGIEIEGIKLFSEEGAQETPLVAFPTTPPPPCVTPCVSTQSGFVQK